MAKQLIFKPNPDEMDYIYENIDSWTDWCRHNLKRCMSNRKYKHIEEIMFRMLLLMGGTLIFSISFFTVNIFLFTVSTIVGSFVSIVASFSMYRIYDKNKKRR